MSKKKSGGGFDNQLAREAGRPNPCQISRERMDELCEKDFPLLLDQITRNRNRQGAYPTYIKGLVANVNFLEYVLNFTKANVKVKKDYSIKTSLSDEQVWSLKSLIAETFRKNDFALGMEKEDREKMASKAYSMLAADDVAILRNVGFSKQEAKELAVHIGGDPVHTILPIIRAFDKLDIGEKKTVKTLRKLYPKANFYRLVGAAMCTSKKSSDTIDGLLNWAEERAKSKKHKYDIWLEYAEAFKVKLEKNLKVPAFYDNKTCRKVIKKLIKYDRTYKKAFDDETIICNIHTTK